MSTFGDRYILHAGRSGHERLRVISEIHDGQTRELLTQAGFGPGHHYVEFGCGLGYVTRWAASRAVHATGIDLSEDQVQVATRLAEEAQIKNVDFRTASIYEPGLTPESIDYSYSRWLLVHLGSPVEAMKVVFQALKPGGIMVCEEADVSGVYTEPQCPAYAELRDLTLASGAPRGVDYYGGRRIHTWAKQAGFEVLHAGAYHPHYVTGPHKGFWSWTLLEASATLVKEGVLTETRLSELADAMRATDDNPEVLVAHCRMHQLIARKPH